MRRSGWEEAAPLFSLSPPCDFAETDEGGVSVTKPSELCAQCYEDVLAQLSGLGSMGFVVQPSGWAGLSGKVAESAGPAVISSRPI